MPTRPELHRSTDTELPVHRTVRPSAAVRPYDRAWRHRSRAFLRRHVFCADPFGVHGKRIEIATQVDHIIPRAAGGGDETSNLQPFVEAATRVRRFASMVAAATPAEGG